MSIWALYILNAGRVDDEVSGRQAGLSLKYLVEKEEKDNPTKPGIIRSLDHNLGHTSCTIYKRAVPTQDNVSRVYVLVVSSDYSKSDALKLIQVDFRDYHRMGEMYRSPNFE
jgi:hypothetical protein